MASYPALERSQTGLVQLPRYCYGIFLALTEVPMSYPWAQVLLWHIPGPYRGSYVLSLGPVLLWHVPGPYRASYVLSLGSGTLQRFLCPILGPRYCYGIFLALTEVPMSYPWARYCYGRFLALTEVPMSYPWDQYCYGIFLALTEVPMSYPWAQVLR